jgi:hypothetical protein
MWMTCSGVALPRETRLPRLPAAQNASGRSVGVVPTRPHVLNLSGRLGPSDAISLRLSTCQMLDVETTSGLRAGATVP